MYPLGCVKDAISRLIRLGSTPTARHPRNWYNTGTMIPAILRGPITGNPPKHSPLSLDDAREIAIEMLYRSDLASQEVYTGDEEPPSYVKEIAERLVTLAADAYQKGQDAVRAEMVARFGELATLPERVASLERSREVEENARREYREHGLPL